MSDNFNPYAQWLGLPATVTSPDHYQLLGIDKMATDSAAIASAADRAMTRVRACKPGPHAAAWAQLLDRIAAAKTALTDPTQRQRYNQQISPPPAATAAPGDSNLLPPTNNTTYPGAALQPPAAAIDPMAPMAPLSMSPQPVGPPVPQPTPAAAIPTAVPYVQPPTPAIAAPDPMAPAAGTLQMAKSAPTTPQAVPDPMAPLVPAAPIAQAIPIASSPMAPTQPVAMPSVAPTPMQVVPVAAPPAATVAGPMLASQPTTTALPTTFAGTPKLKRKPTATARVSSKSRRSLGPILLGASVGGLILVVAGVAVYLAGSPPKASSRTVAAVTPAPLPASSGEVASTSPRRLDEMPESERPRPTVFSPATPTSPRPEPSPQPKTEPVPMMTPTSVTPTTPEPAPKPMPESGPSREELRSLAQSLTTARDAIGELNFAIADRELAKALALAKLDEHTAKISRLQLLREYVGRFQAAIGETLGRVNAGDQIDLGEGKSFGIVELTPDLLVIRVSGRNLRYPMTELPLGLATRLAEMSLDKASPDTSAMKAAFVSVNPKIDDDDRKTADTWWKEAAGVDDVPDLIAAINDDYSLNQDLMAVPLEPSAMAELSARADRLKDARTIDEFAKEFQAAINESLETLEPEMELSVGGSTIITIKELKPDRVMLTVAGETRGFQYNKLPLGLAASIAERILPRDAPLTMVMKGAYYAAREKDQSNKQFRPFVLDRWKQAGEMDQQLQAVIRELVKQYPE